MDLKELQKAQAELQEKMQNDAIDKLDILVDAFYYRVSKSGYSMTLHEVAVFEKIWKQIDFIYKNFR